MEHVTERKHQVIYKIGTATNVFEIGNSRKIGQQLQALMALKNGILAISELFSHILPINYYEILSSFYETNLEHYFS